MTVPAKPVEVGSRCFRSVAQLREFVDRAIASDGIDHGFALALFARHRHGASLSGAGISHFTIEQVREARSIALHRIDGSRVTLVKRRLIAESPWERFTTAARQAVFADVHRERSRIFAAGEVRCVKTGIALTLDTCDMRYAKLTFAEICHAFVDPDPIPETVCASLDIDDVRLDPETAEKFRVYHSRLAVLVPVSRDLRHERFRPR